MQDDSLFVAIALIRRIESSGTKWLGRLNPATKSLRFVLAYPDSMARMRQSIGEAVAWEYQLDQKKDLLVSSMAQLNYEFTESVPAVSNGVPISVSFYNVELYGNSAKVKVDKDEKNYWLTSQEIWQGRSDVGLPLDPLIQQVVAGSQVINEWESSR